VDNLTDAPLFYLKTLALGAVLLAVFSVAGAYSMVALADLTLRGLPGAMVAAGIAGFASVAWWVGVFIVTAQRPFDESTLRDPVLDSVWFRGVNRGLQTAWVLAVVAWVMVIRSGPPVNQIAWYFAVGLQIVGSLGLVALAVHLSCLADWAADSGLAERFKVAAWALAACGLVWQAGRLWGGFSSIGAGFLFLNSIWASIGLSLAQILFLWSLIQLAYIALWAVRNSASAAEASRRILSRREEHDREMAERTRTAGLLSGVNPGFKPPRKPAPRGPSRM